MTKIADIMTRSLATARRDETLQAAAQRMAEMDIGRFPSSTARPLPAW